VKSDEERGPFASWLRRERKAHGWKELDTRRRLEAAAKAGVSFSSYRDLEAGNRKPTADQREAIVAVFGAIPSFTASTGDQSDLAAAIRENTAMMERLFQAIIARLPEPPPDVLRGVEEAEDAYEREQSGTPPLHSVPERPDVERDTARLQARTGE
jgi:transcriptional regulator with XRE-family HTH domain